MIGLVVTIDKYITSSAYMIMYESEETQLVQRLGYGLNDSELESR